MKAASEYLTPVTLELGGKNPVIVLPDCNLKMTAKRLVWGKFHNGGQACVCPDHIYVHQDIEEALIEEIKRFILKFFNGEAEKSGILPLIIDDSHFERLIALIDPGKVILGGRSDKAARYIEPTVLAGVKEEDPIMQEEVFGPLMPILSFDSLDDLLIRLRNKPSPLAMYIFTGNIKKAKKIQREFRSGGGMINDNVVHFVNSSTPFGGFGESGMGAYHGKAGFECFSHRKTVLKKPTWFDLWLKYPPYSKRKLWWIRQFLR
jgi:aldehyde dehydrogenase (NAD+)